MQTITLDKSLPSPQYIRHLARRCSQRPLSRDQIDYRGNGVEDYEQSLYVTALTAAQRAHDSVGYIHRSVQNGMKSARRRKAIETVAIERGLHVSDSGRSALEKLADRSCVELLEKRMSRQDMAVLKAVAAGGTRRESMARLDMNRTTFYNALKVARTQAITILEENNV